ncbi:MAG: CRISPR-associated endonuclease Cas1 [Acidimicrobiales bacterium]|jgi:CRISPR-associated endonuclease Cas1
MQSATLSTSARQPRSLAPEDVADSIASLAETYRRRDFGGVCVADGFGVRIAVERGALEVHDGVGPHRRTRRYDRATHGLRRLVILNAAGIVSLDALRWCTSLGVGVVVLGADGSAQLASTPRLTDDARLRRTQALAPERPYGLDVARYLLGRKVAAQAALVAARFDDRETAETIAELAGAVELAETIEEARQLEASAAALYFGTWSGRPECAPVFAARDRSRVPPHWSRYEGRRSVLASSASNRKAERPVNAILNYCFALLEGEAILACSAVGLDPGLGIVHADARGRASMALDVMEPVRPEVEAFVLDMVGRRTFRKAEFTETTDGHVRLRAPLTHELAETMPTWARSLAPWAEKVAHMLGAVMAGKYSPATPLTGRRTRDAQAVIKARKAAVRQAATSTTTRQRPASEPTVLPLWSCPDCGGAVSNHRHVRCDACIAADPRQAPEIRGRRGAAIAARKRALIEWDQAHPGTVHNPELFRRDILPRLSTAKLSEIVEATGMSKAFASQVRAGKFAPHVSTWRALAELAGVKLAAGPADK